LSLAQSDHINRLPLYKEGERGRGREEGERESGRGKERGRERGRRREGESGIEGEGGRGRESYKQTVQIGGI
jgi:hypothetical protein